MLIYNPAFDLYHCVFRLLQLINKISLDRDIEVNRLKILDFFLLFPSELVNVRFPKDAIEFKKYIPKDENPYNKIPNAKKIFERMETFQITALKSLVSLGFIDEKKLNEGIVKRTEREIPKELKEKIETLTAKQQNLISLLMGPLARIDFFGKSGLKARTNLSEYKYDSQ